MSRVYGSQRFEAAKIRYRSSRKMVELFMSENRSGGRLSGKRMYSFSDGAPDPWESAKDRRLGVCAFLGFALSYGGFPFPSLVLPSRRAGRQPFGVSVK